MCWRKSGAGRPVPDHVARCGESVRSVQGLDGASQRDCNMTHNRSGQVPGTYAGMPLDRGTIRSRIGYASMVRAVRIGGRGDLGGGLLLGRAAGQCYDVTIIQAPDDPFWGALPTVATALSNAGHVVGWSFVVDPYNSHAFIWAEATGLLPLPNPSGHRGSHPPCQVHREALRGRHHHHWLPVGLTFICRRRPLQLAAGALHSPDLGIWTPGAATPGSPASART
jgi:probable HAF family extracellular repeat protein